MQFSEDDLRSALQRKDPGPEFTQRVMARLGQQKNSNASGTMAQGQTFWQRWPAAATWRPVMAGAMAAIIFAVTAWIGIERYERYTAQLGERKMQEQIIAQQAEEQAVLALRIANAKLNHVFQKVNGASTTEPRNRRQTL
jgi:hypothetical protein